MRSVVETHDARILCGEGTGLLSLIFRPKRVPTLRHGADVEINATTVTAWYEEGVLRIFSKLLEPLTVSVRDTHRIHSRSRDSRMSFRLDSLGSGIQTAVSPDHSVIVKPEKRGSAPILMISSRRKRNR